MSFINFALLRQPMNWLVVFLMLVIWGFALDLLHAYATDRHPASAAE